MLLFSQGVQPPLHSLRDVSGVGRIAAGTPHPDSASIGARDAGWKGPFTEQVHLLDLPLAVEDGGSVGSPLVIAG